MYNTKVTLFCIRDCKIPIASYRCQHVLNFALISKNS